MNPNIGLRKLLDSGWKANIREQLTRSYPPLRESSKNKKTPSRIGCHIFLSVESSISSTLYYNYTIKIKKKKGKLPTENLTNISKKTKLLTSYQLFFIKLF